MPKQPPRSKQDFFGGEEPVYESTPVEMGPTRRRENPNQLKLFMRPNEIMDTITDSIDVGMVDVQTRMTKKQPKIMKEVWSRKRRELRGKQYSGLTESIKQHGVIRPITIQDIPGEPLRVGQGHHRIVASAKVEKETGRQIYIPVVYDKNYNYTENPLRYPSTVNERQFRGSREED